MAISGRITRWNAYQLSSYEQLQYHRERRAQIREEIAKMNAQASSLTSVQMQKAVGMGDLVSRMAMERIGLSKKA
ncbi:hypothetical protein O9Z70_09790 [Devosia sp. YIM 151766]|uniref:hypothetical protein n=1 Tax=Devosia sp. YIM 151766 TaxID=3017325 RepID=UPI00255CCF2E|nr:hypothetical protein [Devosia sp. YIM 151766]WIY51778.1 hypothetical protein O9Z70_09790 [Devosia sp. YIM 151766]